MNSLPLFGILGISSLFLFAQIPTDSEPSEQEDPTSENSKLTPLESPAENPQELFSFMTNLAQLTHKLALSTRAKNAPLAEFYLYESTLHLKAIQKEVPEYRGHAIALLIDRMMMPSYEKMKKNLASETPDFTLLEKDFQTIVQNCNQCHEATNHQFIKIQESFETNPFNQIFKP